MADVKRAEFPDSDHPLYTPDEDAQRQVVERIQQAKRGPKRKHPMTHTDKDGVLVIGTYAPMGEHPKVTNTDIGALWGKAHSQAQQLVQHPEKLNPWQVDELCDVLGVTLDWLRGWTNENAFGKYEAPDMVAEMYELLGADDKEHVCYLLKRLLGDEQVNRVKRARRKERNREWLERHPDEKLAWEETTDRLLASFSARLDALSNPILKAFGAANDTELHPQSGDSVEP